MLSRQENLSMHALIILSLQAMVLLGHSTGCQDAVRYVESHAKATDAAPLAGVVLQAAVCNAQNLCWTLICFMQNCHWTEFDQGPPKPPGKQDWNRPCNQNLHLNIM